ncbi:unnamed protein product [Ectocarpus fasciculatus]
MEGGAGAGSAMPGPTRTSWLDAVVFALNETCDGKRWYTSTKELQLASLEFCMVCRNYNTVHLKVDAQTPRRLLEAADAPPPYPKRLCSTRVPRLRARCVTWNIPTAEILTTPIFAMKGANCLEFGRAFEGSVEAVAWPQQLKRVEFHYASPFNQPIDLVQWPATLQRLLLGGKFNRPIEGVAWPDSLQTLEFGMFLNQAIEQVSWPDSLQEVIFGDFFNQPIERVSWPESLQLLHFGEDFNQPIERVVWPASLKRVTFYIDSRFNQPIADVAWPASIQQLYFGQHLNQPIQRVVWPPSLQQVIFVGDFNHPIEGVFWPNSLQRLDFGNGFNQPIDNVRWPPSLQELSFGWSEVRGYNGMAMFSDFDQRIGTSVWPASLRRLTLGDKFRQSLHGLGTWMPNLEAFRLLHHGSGGDSLLRGVEWPKGLRELTVFEESSLDGVVIPSTVEVHRPVLEL